MRTLRTLALSMIVLVVAVGLGAGRSTAGGVGSAAIPRPAIPPGDLLASWTPEPAPQWNQANEATEWVVVPGGVAQLQNGADSRISDFGYSGDFDFMGLFRAIQEPDGDQDDDNFGVVFGWQDESNHYRLGWEGGGFGDNGDEFDPFVDEGATGAHGIWLVREQGGVGTILFELPGVFWTPETAYGFSVSRSGDEIEFEITEGVVVIASATVVDTTFPSGSIGFYVESQEVEFLDLASSEPDLEAPCPALPEPKCLHSAKASLSVDESKIGNEKLKLKLGAIEGATTQQSFGDPVSGDTSYTACLYDGKSGLVAGLYVGPGGTCGNKGKPCWKAKADKGWGYTDGLASSDGVKRLTAKAGAPGKGKVKLQAGNKAKSGKTAMPTRIAAGLEGATSGTVQVLVSDGVCVEAVLDSVKKADGKQFKAKAP